MQFSTAALFVVAAVVVRGEEECPQLQPGKTFFYSEPCCNTENITTTNFKNTAKTCIDKFSILRKSSGPAAATKPDPELVNAFACMVECVFSENKLLTADKKVDKEAVTKLMTASAHADMKPVVVAAIDKCLKSDVDPSHECKSGAAEFRHCLGREILLNCPKSLWTSSAECDGLKTKVTKCPMIPIVLGKPMGLLSKRA